MIKTTIKKMPPGYIKINLFWMINNFWTVFGHFGVQYKIPLLKLGLKAKPIENH